MKQFTICQHVRTGELVAFKEGWSWPGFFFSYAWIAFSRLWELVYTVFLVGGILWLHFLFVDNFFNTETLKYFIGALSILLVVMPFFMGAYGNRLLKRKHCFRYYMLDNNHYAPKSAVTAANKDGAIALFRNKDKEE